MRAVTVKHLVRNCAALLDEIQSTGMRLLLTRHGLPVAIIEPLAHEGLQSVLSGSGSDLEPHDDIDVTQVELDAAEEKVLRAVRSADIPDEIVTVTGLEASRVTVSLGRLEAKGLVIIDRIGRYGLTGLGGRVLAALDAREGSPAAVLRA